jgi:hypothetical protein
MTNSTKVYSAHTRTPVLKERLSVRELINRSAALTGDATMLWAGTLNLHPSTIRRWKQSNSIPLHFQARILSRLGIDVNRYEFVENVERRAATRQPGLKRFVLIRNRDVSGTSGTGTVAEGIQFTNGMCCINWLSKFNSQAIYPDLQTLINIHGHQGATSVKFVD